MQAVSLMSLFTHLRLQKAKLLQRDLNEWFMYQQLLQLELTHYHGKGS